MCRLNKLIPQDSTYHCRHLLVPCQCVSGCYNILVPACETNDLSEIKIVTCLSIPGCLTFSRLKHSSHLPTYQQQWLRPLGWLVVLILKMAVVVPWHVLADFWLPVLRIASTLEIYIWSTHLLVGHFVLHDYQGTIEKSIVTDLLEVAVSIFTQHALALASETYYLQVYLEDTTEIVSRARHWSHQLAAQ